VEVLPFRKVARIFPPISGKSLFNFYRSFFNFVTYTFLAIVVCSTDGSDHESDEKVCEDTLYALFFLRDPFFKLDVVKCESMLEAFFSLESFEKDCSASYLNEMVKLQDELMVKRNLIGNCIDEIDELTMLGKDVKQSLIAKISTRRTNKSVRLEIRTKTCATFWNNCLRMFEESWSPWSSELEGGENMVGYTASVHRDSSMRRMVMFRNDEHVDYSDAAYFEGKLRDQQDFDGVVNDDSYEEDISKGNVSNPSSTLSFMKDTLQLTRPKASKLNTTDSAANDNSDDDNDSTEDAEETTIDIKRNENIFSAVLNNNIEKRPLWALTFAWHPDEREIFSAEVMEIMTEQVLAGTVLLTNRNIYFHPKKRAGGFLVKPDEFRNKRWQLSKMTECYGRRYLLQNCGIELFFMDSPELFFAFNTHKESNRFFRYLKKQSLQSLTMPLSLSPSYIFQHSNWTELWKKRAISNFEYIMRLNIIAGRSYNDITQYPVFPWVLCDYESETIDLNDPAVYRDLSKPIGALNPERLVEILDRYNSFGEMDMPQFMYGSHYSSAGLILHFMIRQEPFTSMAITLQGGRFDCPDRLFFNIKETWKCCNTSMSDVKELVPQMFYFPEAFVNSNSLPLGDLQDEKGAVDKVVLPPWCNDDPFEFVRIHREALESEFVSQHLHEWIDLIFGFKQTGQAAVEANNVFHYLTYENAIDIEAITDPLQRAAAKAQVTHFGQTPSQIMTKEHPKRNDIDDCIISFCAFPTTTCLDRFQCYLHPKQCGMNNEHGAVVSINCSSNLLVVFYADFTVGYHKWSTVPETNKTPFSLKFDKSRVIPNCNSSIFYHHIPAKEDADISEKISPIRSRASSVGEGLLAARNNLFKRTLFPQGDKSRTLSMESVVTASTIANISNETSKKNDEFGKDGGVDCDEEEDDDISRSESSFGSSTIKKTEYSSHTPFSDDSFADDTSIDTRPSLDDNFSLSKIKNKHVAFKMGEGSNGFVLSCGYWNNAMKVHSLKDSLVEVMCKSGGHHGQITCLDVGSNQHILVTGGQDGTCRVWHINGSVDLSLERQHVLLGHTDPLTAIAYSCHHDLVLSASRNGFLCLHTAQRGRFIRSISTLSTTHSHPVDQVAISSAGYLITHSSIDCCMNVFWINGQHLKRIVLESRYNIIL
jgi:WD40 repeat protein